MGYLNTYSHSKEAYHILWLQKIIMAKVNSSGIIVEDLFWKEILVFLSLKEFTSQFNSEFQVPTNLI